MPKQKLIDHLQYLLDDVLEISLQGDYDERNAILGDFESIIDAIKDYDGWKEKKV